jgi:hypothetical protein
LATHGRELKKKTKKDAHMKTRPAPWLSVLSILVFLSTGVVWLKAKSQDSSSTAQAKAGDDAKQKNIQEYVNLLRADVRKEKTSIMGAVLELSPEEAAKFWPIYNQYDSELTKLNDLRVANIQEYARNYDQMTDSKADELIRNAFDYRKQRSELLSKYYGRVKESLGSVQAARFVQIEDQLLMIIDLQIASDLPVVDAS